MEFIISKIALSICCLLVICVLSGAFRSAPFDARSDELERRLSELCALVDRLSMSLSETGIVWDIPRMSDGEPMRVTIYHDHVVAESDGTSKLGRTICDIHLWHWNGTPLNSAAVAGLDATANPLCLSSGQRLSLGSRMVTYENEPRPFVFVSAEP